MTSERVKVSPFRSQTLSRELSEVAEVSRKTLLTLKKDVEGRECFTLQERDTGRERLPSYPIVSSPKVKSTDSTFSSAM